MNENKCIIHIERERELLCFRKHKGVSASYPLIKNCSVGMIVIPPKDQWPLGFSGPMGK